MRSSASSIFSTLTATSSQTTDAFAVNLGVKFQANADGYIKGVRFYKHLNNTGVHSGYLWSSTGALLGSATFTNESASGLTRAR